MARPARFNYKAFFSFSILIFGIVMSLTGIILYFVPAGRVAFWTNWKFLGLTKSDWQAVHTIFSFLFVIIAGFHLYYNWVIFVSYLKSKVLAGIKMKRELVWSSSLSLLILIGTLAGVPPFSTVMDFGEYLSESWSNQQTEPPVPHAELLTLKKYCETTQMDLQQAMRRLQQQGIKGVDSLATIGDIAQKNNLTPVELAQKISAKPSSGSANPVGSGYGRKTLGQICQDLNIDPALAAQRLKSAGIEWAQDENLRTIADRSDKTPLEIVNIIKGQSPGREQR